MRGLLAIVAACALVSVVPAPLLAHKPGGEARLPAIGPAPAFTLATADGGPLALADLRGKVVAVTFIYATCADTCPLLTAKLVEIRRRLARQSAKVAFVAITVDPERDTPEVLRNYARAHGANVPGWSFLTGSAVQIQDVTRAYGVFARKAARGDVDHTFLTSLVDREGVLRVQYMGFRFAPEEMLRDLRALLAEGGR